MNLSSIRDKMQRCCLRDDISGDFDSQGSYLNLPKLSHLDVRYVRNEIFLLPPGHTAYPFGGPIALESRNISSASDYRQISHMYNNTRFPPPPTDQMRGMTPMHISGSFPGHPRLGMPSFPPPERPASISQFGIQPGYFPEVPYAYNRDWGMHSNRRPPKYPRGRGGSGVFEGRGQRGRGQSYRGSVPMP